MAVILPVSLGAQESQAAMLTSNGGVLVDHNPVPASIALLLHDLVETQPNVVAQISLTGSIANLSPETLLQYENNELVMDHGTVDVHTSRGMRVRAGCITVTPVNLDSTDYAVEDKNGEVKVTANTNDVYIDEHSSNPEKIKSSERSHRTIVHQGETKSRSEKCGALILKAPVLGPLMNNPWVVAAGAIIVGGITCYALCREPQPVSPKDP